MKKIKYIANKLRYKGKQIEQLDNRLEKMFNEEYEKNNNWLRELFHILDRKKEWLIAEKCRLIKEYNILYSEFNALKPL